MDAAEKAGKEIEKMKSKLIAVAALAALTAAAMPTKDEIAQANKEVQVSLKRQIAAWQSGDISDGDLAVLMLSHADKFKDEPYADITVPEGGSFDDLVKLCDSKNIGEDMDKVVARLAEENDLRGVIDNAKFNDETKIG